MTKEEIRKAGELQWGKSNAAHPEGINPHAYILGWMDAFDESFKQEIIKVIQFLQYDNIANGLFHRHAIKENGKAATGEDLYNLYKAKTEPTETKSRIKFEKLPDMDIRAPRQKVLINGVDISKPCSHVYELRLNSRCPWESHAECIKCGSKTTAY